MTEEIADVVDINKNRVTFKSITRNRKVQLGAIIAISAVISALLTWKLADSKMLSYENAITIMNDPEAMKEIMEA